MSDIQALKQNNRLICHDYSFAQEQTLLSALHPPPPPSPHKTKFKEGLFNLIVKMLYCRHQADDLIRCIIIIMFQMINSQREALHYHYEMWSVIPQTLLHAGWGWAREIEKLHSTSSQKKKSMSQHRYAIYQLHHLKTQTKIMQLWIGQTIVSQHITAVSQNKNLEAVRYSVRKILTLPLNK